MNPRWRFGEFELDAGRFQLLRRGKRVPLQRKPLFLLMYLLQNADRAVPSAELMRVVWPDVAVTEASLRRAVRVLRQALGESGQRSVESIRGYGYRFVGALAVQHAADPQVTEGRVRGGGDPFVGRTDELGALDLALARAIEGAAGCVLISGPPGMGKSRLVREFTDRAEDRGAAVVVGQCWEGEGSPAFWPWAPMLQDLSGSKPDGDLDAPLSPEKAPTRFRLFADTIDTLRSASERHPLLLVFEDIHWAQEPALLLLKFAFEQLQHSRVLLVCSCRDTLVCDSDARAGIVASLQAKGQTLTLRPLPESDVASLLQTSRSLAVDEQLTKSVHRLSGGNPLFVRELIPLLEEQQGSAPSDGDILRGAVIPAGIRETIAAQLRPLGPSCNRVLRQAAVLGDEFAVAVLADASSEDAAGVLENLDLACARQILIEMRPGLYRFAHALIRETIYDQLSSTDRVTLHHAAALAYERLGYGRSDEHAGTVAHHFSRAVALPGIAERAVDYAMRAARVSLRSFAYEQARDLFEQARQLVVSAGTSAERHVEVLIGLGDAERLCGASEAAKRTFLAAAELGRACRRPEVLAEAALAYGRAHYDTGAVDQTLATLLEEALATLPTEDSILRIALLARLGTMLQFDRDAPRRLAIAREAVDAARRIGDDNALAAALTCQTWNCWSTPEAAVRSQMLRTATEAAKVAQRCGNLELLAQARMLRCTALLASGAGAEMKDELALYDELAERTQQPMLQWFGKLTHVACLLLEGFLDDGERMSFEVFEAGQRLHVGVAPVFLVCQSLMLARDRGTMGVWLEGFLQAAKTTHYSSFGMARAACAVGYSESGAPDAARHELEQLSAAGLEQQLHDPNWPSIFVLAADAAAAIHHRETAAQLYDLLLPHESLVACIGTIASVHGSAAHALGVLALSLGRDDLAVRHLELAQRMAQQMRARPMQARAELALCEALLARGDHGRAANHLRQAELLADAIGMKFVQSKARALASSQLRQ